MMGTAPRLLFVFLMALQLPSPTAGDEGPDPIGGGWTLQSNGQCYGKKKKEVSNLGCEEGLALKGRMTDLESLVAALRETVDNLHNQTAPQPTPPVQKFEIEATGLNPKRSDGKNCLKYVGETGMCGVGLTLYGASGLVCFPSEWDGNQLRNFAQAVATDRGFTGATLEELGPDNTPGSLVYGMNYFDDPEGLEGYWNVSACTADSQDIQDYANCATATTFNSCSKEATEGQRFLALFFREN